MKPKDVAASLRLCAHDVAMCDECPYKGDPPDPECYKRLYNDAADLIENTMRAAIIEKQERIREIEAGQAILRVPMYPRKGW